MEKILKFPPSIPPKKFEKRPPKISTNTYYSEYEEDNDIFMDNSTQKGLFVKVYTKKEPLNQEQLKVKYETDQEPNGLTTKG